MSTSTRASLAALVFVGTALLTNAPDVLAGA
jgi:hypothetical protein